MDDQQQPKLRYVPDTEHVRRLVALLSLTDHFIYRNHLICIYSRFFDAFDDAAHAYRILSREIVNDDTKKIVLSNLTSVFEQIE
jgi:hypothetical protein